MTVQPVRRWRFRCCHDAMPGRYPSSCKFLHSLCRKEDLPADIAFAPSRARHRSHIEPAAGHYCRLIGGLPRPEITARDCRPR